MYRRTTLIIDAELLDRARELTGIREKTALVRAGLEALIAREAGKRLADRLSDGLVLMHPFVVGELACDNLKGRDETLSDLNALPSARVAFDSEALQLIEGRRRNWG